VWIFFRRESTNCKAQTSQPTPNLNSLPSTLSTHLKNTTPHPYLPPLMSTPIPTPLPPLTKTPALSLDLFPTLHSSLLLPPNTTPHQPLSPPHNFLPPTHLHYTMLSYLPTPTFTHLTAPSHNYYPLFQSPHSENSLHPPTLPYPQPHTTPEFLRFGTIEMEFFLSPGP